MIELTQDQYDTLALLERLPADYTVTTTPSVPKSKRGRPPIQHNNRFVRLWLHRWLDRRHDCPSHLDPNASLDESALGIIESPSIYQLPCWCHDVIVGAARLNGSDKYTGLPMNTSTIIRILLELDVLTNANVKEYMEGLNGKEISRQYGQQLTSAAISASKSIDYHLEMREQVEEMEEARLIWEEAA